MCDTLVSVDDNGVWFGKNSDREPGEAQIVEQHGDVILSRPFWMNGAEMGVNARGVAIGNEAVFTRIALDNDGVTGMDMLRVALEQAGTAREAVDVIVRTLKSRGQGGRMGYRNVKFRYSSSFLIADRTEAWVLETAGKFFAAKKIARGVNTISNELTLGKDVDLVDDDALNHAKSKGWCTSASDFDFTQCFSDKVMSKLAGAAERRACTTAVLSRSGQVDLSVVMNALRDHGGASPLDGLVMKMPCAHAGPWPTRTSGQTTGSLIVRSTRDDVKAWSTGTSSPCISVFKPLSFSNFDAGPKPAGRYDSESLWWRHERLHRIVLADYQARALSLG
jgi:secernin